MPIIKRQRTWCGGIETTLIIKYSTKEKIFIADLPEQIAQALGKNRVWSETEDKAERAFYEAGKEYKERQTTIRKVIAYRIEIQASISRDDKNVLSREDIHFTDCDHAMGLGYKVLNETKFGDKVNYHYLNGNYVD